jgi:hypothetical protein
MGADVVKSSAVLLSTFRLVDSKALPCLPAGRKTRHIAKRQNVSDIFTLGAFLLVKEEKEKAGQVFQHMLQLKQWGAYGFIAAEVEMKRL